MKEFKKIISTGMKVSANRQQVLLAQKEFEKYVEENLILQEKFSNIIKIIRLDIANYRAEFPNEVLPQQKPWWSEFNDWEAVPMDIVEEYAYESAVEWISETLSPTYIHSKDSRKKLPTSTKDGYIGILNGNEIINKLNSKTVLDYVVDYNDYYKKSMDEIIKILSK